MQRCPGQDQRFWKPEDIFEIKCPNCDNTIEFWKDEPNQKCKKCAQLVANPKIDLGCAKWCKYAKQCLTVSAAKDSQVLCDKLIDEMKAVFIDDQKRINHALEVLKYAEKIQLAQGGDPLVVKAAALLHDIGIAKAEKEHDSADPALQQTLGPPIANDILIKHGVEPELIDHICKIIAEHHTARNIDTTEFQIVFDADWLVNFPDHYPNADKQKTKDLIDKTFKTKTGRQLAAQLFLNA